MNRKTSKHQEFLDELIRKAQGPRSTEARFFCMSDPREWDDPIPLLEILSVDTDHLSLLAQKTLDVMTELPTDQICWEDFLWSVCAFFEIQDVFDSPLLRPRPEKNCLRIWYFYFEARHLLRESILAGLNALYSASVALLRTFLEFNLLQLYFYRLMHEATDYSGVDAYFRSGVTPKQSTILGRVVPSNSFCSPIRARLKRHLEGLSSSVAHAYSPDMSPRRHGARSLQPSLEGMFFWIQIHLVVQSVLWGYYASFPMLFYPQDLLSRFGFNPPMGLFVDSTRAAIVRKTLSEEDYSAFLEHSQGDEQRKLLCDWAASMPPLTEQQIRESWNSEENGELGEIFPRGYSIMMAKIRGMRETLAWDFKNEEADSDQLFEFCNRLRSYEGWKRLHKTLGN